ncbi:MAG: hypothetical protein ACR2OE_02920 [Thermomicrobiales bacterium]
MTDDPEIRRIPLTVRDDWWLPDGPLPTHLKFEITPNGDGTETWRYIGYVMPLTDQSDSDDFEVRKLTFAPLPHHEFQPPEDFTGMWHGVEYIRGGRVCPGPRFSEMTRSKQREDQ